MNNLRFALRRLRQSPGFTVTAIAVLAIGIGLNTAIFSIVDAVALRPLPFPEPERLLQVGEQLNSFGEVGASFLNYLDWSKQAKTLQAAAIINNFSATLSDGKSAERIPVLNATHGILDVIGIQPARGRGFEARDDEKNAPGRVIITDALWKRRFASDPHIVGRAITLQGKPFTVVGVLPASFRFPFVKFDAIMPLGPLADREHRGSYSGGAVARLRPGATLAQARAEFATIEARLAAAHPDSNSGWHMFLRPLQSFFTKDTRQVMLTLLAAVTLVLLIACVNLAGLMLVRGAGRRRELAVRVALGASRLAILRETLSEAVLLAIVGGGFGILLGSWAIGPLLALVPETQSIPAVTTDGRVLAFAIGATLLSALLFGVAPALRASSTDPQEALSEAGRSNSGGAQSQRLRSGLVVAEISLALMLVLAAGLVLKSFDRLVHVNPGFAPDHTLTMSVALTGPDYSKDPAKILFWNRLLHAAAQDPSIGSVGVVSFLPMTDHDSESAYWIEGKPKPKSIGSYAFADNFVVSGSYFQTMDIALVKGRTFRDTDDEKAPRVVIVDKDFVRKNFPHTDPFAHRVMYDNKPYQVIGIVKHVKAFGLNGATREQFYFPYQQDVRDFMTVVARPAHEAGGGSSAAVSATRASVRSIDAGVPVYEVRPMASWLDDSTWRARISSVLLGLFAAVALVLAGLGIYGVMAYSVAQRTREIGIRLALGATPQVVLQMILRQGFTLCGIGILIGTVSAFPLANLLQSLLFDVSPTDIGVLSAAGAVLAAISLISGAIPALRAARVDPNHAIRYE